MELYVDELLLTSSEPLMVECKMELASEFEMKNLVLMHYLMGSEVWKTNDDISLSQRKYVVKLLVIFGRVECNYMATPMEINFNHL